MQGPVADQRLSAVASRSASAKVGPRSALLFLPCCGTAASTGPCPQGGLLWNTTALEHGNCDPIASHTAIVLPLCPVIALARPKTQNGETVATWAELQEHFRNAEFTLCCCST